jgi:hypothetical protein
VIGLHGTRVIEVALQRQRHVALRLDRAIACQRLRGDVGVRAAVKVARCVDYVARGRDIERARRCNLALRIVQRSCVDSCPLIGTDRALRVIERNRTDGNRAALDAFSERVRVRIGDRAR